jgi:hypothetical protein
MLERDKFGFRSESGGFISKEEYDAHRGRHGLPPLSESASEAEPEDNPDDTDADARDEDELEGSENEISGFDPSFAWESFRQHIEQSGIPKKAYRAILNYIEDIDSVTINTSSDQHELYLCRFFELVASAVDAYPVYEGTRGLAHALSWISRSDIHADDDMAGHLLSDLEGLADVLSGIATSPLPRKAKQPEPPEQENLL